MNWITANLCLIPALPLGSVAILNFLAFWRYGPNPEALTGVMFVIFSIAVAAAEAAVALIIAIYRHYKSANVDEANSLKG